MAGIVAAPRRAGSHLPSTRHLRPGPQRHRPGARGTARRIDKPGQVFSRIHVEDIAATLEASIDRPRGGAIYNVADDEPAPNAEVIACAFELLGQPVPPAIPYDRIAPTLSPIARSFYADSRRVRNSLIKSELGVRLAYPTYREGLLAIHTARGRR